MVIETALRTVLLNMLAAAVSNAPYRNSYHELARGAASRVGSAGLELDDGSTSNHMIKVVPKQTIVKSESLYVLFFFG